MRTLFGTLSGLTIAVSPGVALAEGMSGYSRGNAIIYFAAIAAVLIYGVHDVFHKKWLTWGAAIAIPVALYLSLPKQ
jgi:hypothetical protein